MQAQDKVIIVTGGGNGLGRALVIDLLRRGAKVAAVDISEPALQETVNLCQEHKSNLSTHVVDITDLEAISRLKDEVLAHHGAVDGLINNAGIIQPFVRINDLPLEKIEQVMKVNFFGMLYMTKTFLPILLDRPEAAIVNVASMGGFFPVTGQTAYGASKAAVKLFTEGLRTELLGTNVQATLILPGSMGTNIAQNSGVKMSDKMKEMEGSVKTLSPEKAASIIVNSMERGKFRVLVGGDAKMMSMLYKLLPGYAPKVFAKMIGSKLLED